MNATAPGMNITIPGFGNISVSNQLERAQRLANNGMNSLISQLTKTNTPFKATQKVTERQGERVTESKIEVPGKAKQDSFQSASTGLADTSQGIKISFNSSTQAAPNSANNANSSVPQAITVSLNSGGSSQSLGGTRGAEFGIKMI